MQPHELREGIQQFDRANTAFALSRTDPSLLAGLWPGRSVEQRIESGKAGYGREEFALHDACRAAESPLRAAWKEGIAPADSRYVPQDWAEFTDRLKLAAITMGAAAAGVAVVNPLWLYKGVELPDGVDRAVVLAVAMDRHWLSASPAPMAAAATALGYARMAFVATAVARYLAELGYLAVPSGNDLALSVPLAIDAALGEAGRNGMLITPTLGPRVRLCKVFTNAPLTCDRTKTFGVVQTCSNCTVCAERCPAGAIPRGQRTTHGESPCTNDGAFKWYIRPERCLAFWKSNATSCSNCIRYCPLAR